MAEKFLRNFSMIPEDFLHFGLSSVYHANIEPGFCLPEGPGVHKAPALGQAANRKATVVHGKSLLAPVTDDPLL